MRPAAARVAHAGTPRERVGRLRRWVESDRPLARQRARVAGCSRHLADSPRTHIRPVDHDVTDFKLQFAIEPSSGVPIYRQLMDQIRALAASGRLAPGTLLPSIRQLAADLEVNMMTISKAYSRLEAEGLLERVRGTGMRVCGRPPSGNVVGRQKELEPLVDAMVLRAMQLNLTQAQVLAVVRDVFKERSRWSNIPSKSTT